MFKYQLFKPSRLRFDNWPFGPEKFSGHSRNRPLQLFIESPETSRARFGFHYFISSPKRTRLEPRNFPVILICILFTTYEKTSFTEEAKFLGTIEKRASGLKITCNMKNKQIKVKSISWSASNSRRNCCWCSTWFQNYWWMEQKFEFSLLWLQEVQNIIFLVLW